MRNRNYYVFNLNSTEKIILLTSSKSNLKYQNNKRLIFYKKIQHFNQNKGIFLNKFLKRINKFCKFNINYQLSNKKALIFKNNSKNTKIFKKPVHKKLSCSELNKNKFRIFMTLLINFPNKIKNSSKSLISLC